MLLIYYGVKSIMCVSMTCLHFLIVIMTQWDFGGRTLTITFSRTARYILESDFFRRSRQSVRENEASIFMACKARNFSCLAVKEKLIKWNVKKHFVHDISIYIVYIFFNANSNIIVLLFSGFWYKHYFFYLFL